jgi:replicative DNA helicase
MVSPKSSRPALPLFEHARRHPTPAVAVAVTESPGGSRVSSGLVGLDRALGGGFLVGSLALVAARPKVGAGSLLLGATIAAMKAGVRCAYLSDQLTVPQLRGRLVVLEARVNGYRFRAGFIAPEDQVALTAARERLAWRAVTLVGQKNLDVDAIDEHVFEYRPRFLVCDLYPRVRGGGRRLADLVAASTALAELARRRKVAVVLRYTLPLGEGSPTLADLPGPGALSPCIRQLVLLHREEVTMPKADLAAPVGLAEARVYERDGGDPAAVRLHFDGRFGGLSDVNPT